MNERHSIHNCKCFTCELMKQGYSESMAFYIKEQREKELKKKYGFVVNYIIPEGDKAYTNYYTEGFSENKNHLEFQIVLPISPELAQHILWTFATLVDKGNKYVGEQYVSEILENFDVKLKQVNVKGIEYLRIILPDKNGLFKGDFDCEEYYARQEDI